MIYLSDLFVEQFRGIKDLEVKNLGNVNLIVGDNNSGKTSVLEAIMLLRNVKEISNILNVARLRVSTAYSPFRQSMYDDFIYLFNQQENEKLIAVQGTINEETIGLTLHGKIENVMVDYRELNENDGRMMGHHSLENTYEERIISEFQGSLDNYSANQKASENVKINQFTKLTGMNVGMPSIVEMTYVSPTEHAFRNIFYSILKNDDYKQIVLQVIQIFDQDIEDLLYLTNEQTSRPVEYLKHKKLGNMPITTYGDGVRKVILLANSIVKSVGGILLIDEIETAIHASYYDDIFSFVIKACKQFNIQLFATTHSIEAVDGFLATQYDKDSDVYDQEKNDLIRVITFRKSAEKNTTDARVLTGEQVYRKREKFGFEVRE